MWLRSRSLSVLNSQNESARGQQSFQKLWEEICSEKYTQLPQTALCYCLPVMPELLQTAPSASFPLHRRWEPMHVGHFASRVTFILYLCKGYGVVHNDLSSFINVLFQTGSLKKQQITLSLKPKERHTGKRSCATALSYSHTCMRVSGPCI